MSEKQDKINAVLTERISQLEDELRITKTDLAEALTIKTRIAEEMEKLKTEAFSVVEEWSVENSQQRVRLADSESKLAESKAALENREQTVACLKEELNIAQQLSTQYLEENKKLQKSREQCEGEVATLSAKLTAANATAMEAMKKAAEHESTAVRLQVEVNDALEKHKSDATTVDELRSALQKSTAENRELREAGANVSWRTEELLEHLSRFKDENVRLQRANEDLLSGNSTLVEEKARLLKNYQTLLEDKESLSRQLSAALVDVSREREGNQKVTNQLTEVTGSLKKSQDVVDEQCEQIKSLESDIGELKDGQITASKMVEDLQSELDFSRQVVNESRRLKEEVETECSAIKENLANILMEYDDYKRTSTTTVRMLESDFATFKRDSNERCALAEQNSNSAWLSVKELTGALYAQQQSELTKTEQIMRASLMMEQHAEFSTVLEKRFRATVKQLTDSTAALVTAETHLRQVECNASTAAEQLEIMAKRFRASEQNASEMRRTLSSLESQLSKCSADLKVRSSECDSLSKDNTWLKDQVETMRQELGELDEILNSNLNDLREENERLQIENASLKGKAAASAHSAQESVHQTTVLEAKICELESELRAQTKTLEITEAELQAVKAQMENLSTSLEISVKRAEELESLRAEMIQSNEALKAQAMQLHERLGSQDSRVTLLLSDKRKEADNLKQRLNAYVEKYEQCEERLQAEIRSRKEFENAGTTMKEQNVRLRSALEELKARCANDAVSLKDLLSERNDLIHDRDIIVEKYNKLHDAFCNVRKDAHGKMADELKKVMELAMSQETELQNLREQNITLRKSVSMFVESAQPKAEAVFMERLNLNEGPLRHPKKRNTTNATEQ